MVKQKGSALPSVLLLSALLGVLTLYFVNRAMVSASAAKVTRYQVVFQSKMIKDRNNLLDHLRSGSYESMQALLHALGFKHQEGGWVKSEYLSIDHARVKKIVSIQVSHFFPDTLGCAQTGSIILQIAESLSGLIFSQSLHFQVALRESRQRCPLRANAFFYLPLKSQFAAGYFEFSNKKLKFIECESKAVQMWTFPFWQHHTPFHILLLPTWGQQVGPQVLLVFPHAFESLVPLSPVKTAEFQWKLRFPNAQVLRVWVVSSNIVGFFKTAKAFQVVVYDSLTGERIFSQMLSHIGEDQIKTLALKADLNQRQWYLKAEGERIPLRLQQAPLGLVMTQ